MSRRVVAVIVDGARAAAIGVTMVSVDAAPAVAHDGQPLLPHDLWSAWEWNLMITLPLFVSAALYVRGVRRLWRKSAPGRGVRASAAAAFVAGWSALLIALISPLHALGGSLFSAHMIQHELLMVVAAPLLVLGRPLVAFVFALPPRARRRVGSWVRRWWVRRGWHALTTTGVAWWAHAIALGVWHVPALYEETLSSATAHALQHASFLATALLFWWAILQPRPGQHGASIIYLFAATLFTGALGAMLAFAPEPWYPSYATTSGVWGLTPLEDQQLGGIIMWVPGGASYVIAALALFLRWLRESERRARGYDARIPPAIAKGWRSA